MKRWLAVRAFSLLFAPPCWQGLPGKIWKASAISQLFPLVPHHLFSFFSRNESDNQVKAMTWSGILHRLVVEAAEAAVADIKSVPPNAGTCPPGAGIGSWLLSYRGFSDCRNQRGSLLCQGVVQSCCAQCVDMMLPDPRFWRDDFHYYGSIFVCFPCHLVYHWIISM